MEIGGNITGNQTQKFRDRVWAILLVEYPDIYRQAQEHKDEINEMIDMGNENLWDTESVAYAITQGF